MIRKRKIDDGSDNNTNEPKKKNNVFQKRSSKENVKTKIFYLYHKSIAQLSKETDNDFF